MAVTVMVGSLGWCLMLAPGGGSGQQRCGQLLDETGQLRLIDAVESPGYHLAVSATRYVSFERAPRNRVHRHTFYEPCIVATGMGEFEHGSQLYALRPGDLFMAQPGTYHEIRSLTTRDLGIYFLAFSMTPAARRRPSPGPPVADPALLARFASGHHLHVSGQTQLVPLFEHALQLWRRDANESRSRFYQSVATLLLEQIMAALATTAVPAQRREELALSGRITAAIEQHLHLPLRVAALARACGMSERTLRRRWQALGEGSLRRQIERQRAQRAAHLLLVPDVSVAEVAAQVGLEDPAQFSRAFRAVHGQSPSQYRRRYLSQLPGKRPPGPPFRTEFREGDRREYES
jgi:AraC-like DNA-binding protein/quercetin dioxygenase-like cupin family protein